MRGNAQQDRTTSDLFLFLMVVNSISGAGVFINAKPLAVLGGSFGALAYVVGLLVILPIALTLTGMAQAKPVAGGMFTYVKDAFSAKIGFISTWAYFLSKVVSAALLTQAFCLPLKQYFFPQMIGTIWLETAIIASLTLLNIFGVKLYGNVQLFFSVVKAIPFLVAILLAVVVLAKSQLQTLLQFGAPTNIFAAFPVAIYAISGFEVASTMAHTVKNVSHIRRVSLYAFAVVGFLYVSFQLGGQLLGGPALVAADSPLVFLTERFMSYLGVFGVVAGLCMRVAALTITFSILANNCWNLFALAKDGLLPGSSFLCRVNGKFVPWVALCVEAALAIVVMSITSNQIALQSIVTMAMAISFVMVSFAALLYWKRKHNNKELLICFLSICSSMIMLGLSFKNVLAAGVSLPFIGLFLIGIIAVLFRYVWQSLLCVLRT